MARLRLLITDYNASLRPLRALVKRVDKMVERADSKSTKKSREETHVNSISWVELTFKLVSFG